MLRSVPRAWVYSGAFALSGVAGAVNAVAITCAGLEHRGVTHVTGTLTEASARLAGVSQGSPFPVLAVVGAFLLGALLSGLIIRDDTLRRGRHYGVGLALEGALLVGAGALDGLQGVLLAAVACGLQNALATHFSGAVLRTTHMTGVVTDLGLLVGHALRGQAVDGWRLWLYLALLGGFSLGGVGGALLGALMGRWAFLVPASALFTLAGAYWAWMKLVPRKAA